jgi:glycosidase
MFLVASSDACAKTMYLNTGGSSLWEKDNANKFAVWYWHGSNQGEWSAWMTRAEGNVWQTSVSEACDHVIFCRFDNSMSTPDWGDNKVWNKSADLEISSGQNLYTVTDWENGTWSVYGEDPGGGKEPVTPTDYSTAVPSQCEDVMLQVFYWDSYKNQTGNDSKYGRTRWVDLLKDTAAINANFDLVWFPPSAYGDGGNGSGGVGYTHRQLSNQTSDWGSRAKLEELIAALHRGDTRVLADIVINHRGNKSNWCDFYADNFGTYVRAVKKECCLRGVLKDSL